MPLRDCHVDCTDCGVTMTIRVLDLPQWEEERMATVLCKACLERRVQVVEGARYSRVERRGRPRKSPP